MPQARCLAEESPAEVAMTQGYQRNHCLMSEASTISSCAATERIRESLRSATDGPGRRCTHICVCEARISVEIIASCLWAPPVATQFSVLSQTFVKVRAPPVATLLFHLISSHHFSWHRLWRHSFLLFGHRQWRPSDRQTDRRADPCKKHILFSFSPSSSSDYYI